MRGRNLIYALIIILFAIPVLSANRDISKITAGRVRFAIGHPEFDFNGKKYSAGFDYLVLLGSTYNTNDGKLEIVDFNSSTYYFDKNTKFHFETIDIGGDRTTLYFGKGKAVIETRKPVVLSLASASVFLPENGTYLVLRDTENRDRVYITKLEGKQRPYFVKKNKIFSRVYFNRKKYDKFVDWYKRRKHDWALTRSRLMMNSMVDRMPPVVAYTDDSGKTHWYRVNSVKPIYQIDNILFDNWFIFDPVLVHAYGLLSPATIYMTDYQLWLWFTVNRYNSIKWAWDPYHGWHAEFYYDPLAGFGAEYGFSVDYLAWQLSLLDYLERAGYHYYDNCIIYGRGWDIIRPLPHVREKVFRFIKKPVAIRARLNTDPEIRSANVAAKIGLRKSDYRRIDYYAEGGGNFRMRRNIITHSPQEGSIGLPVAPIYTIKPVRVIRRERKSAVR